MASSANSPCAACKSLRRKCTQECMFAPYFPPDQPTKFSNVHKIFGASNVTKILSDINPSQREDAVNSLAYEAEARLRDPVYGCVGLIFMLQQKFRQVQLDLCNAKKELSTYIGPSELYRGPGHQQHHLMHQPHQNPSSSSMVPFGMSSAIGLPPPQAQLQIREQQQQQMLDAQQLAAFVAAREQQEMLRIYEQQQEIARFNSGGFDVAGSSGTGGGFNQMTAAGDPSLAAIPFDGPFQIQQEQQEHQQQPLQQQQQQRGGSDEGT